MYKEAKKEARGQRSLLHRSRGWMWLLVSIAVMGGCTSLGSGDGLYQADQLARQKRFKPLAELLTHPHSQVRGRALYHIAKSPSQNAHRELASFLASASELWRQEALVQLLASGRQDALANQLLMRLCRDLHAEIKLSTLAELGHRQQLTPDLWRCMIESLADRNKAIARLAHLGLRRQGWRSLPHLRVVIEKNKPNLAASAIALLQEITVQPWRTRARWLRWYKDGEATLFKLRHTGQWPRHKALLARLIKLRSPAVRRDALALLAQLAPADQGLSMLATLPTTLSLQAMTLWGERGGRALRTLLQMRPSQATPAHISAFGAWLTPSSQGVLLPYLDPARPAHCKAALEALLRSVSHTHLAMPATVDALDGLARKAPAPLSHLALSILWHAGELRPGRTRGALMALHFNPKTTSRTHLTALANWAAWRQDHEIVLRLIKQLRESTALQPRRELLAALAYIGHFTSIAPAATTAFALGMKHPHALRTTSYHLLHTLPPRQRYTWLLLLAPKLTPPQWHHFLDQLLLAKRATVHSLAAQRLLTMTIAPSMPWSLRRKTARVITRHRISPLKQRVFALLPQAPQRDRVALAEIIGAWGSSRAKAALRRTFRKTRHIDARWRLAIARLRCGDADALRWCENRLTKAKGHAWHAPKQLLRLLLAPEQPKDPGRRKLYAKGRKLLLQHHKKLRHLFSSPLAAYALIQANATSQGLLALLQRLKRRSEPASDKAQAIAWLKTDRRAAWLRLLASKAPDVTRQGLLKTALWVLAKLANAPADAAQKRAVLLTLHQLSADKRLDANSRQLAARALQPPPQTRTSQAQWQRRRARLQAQLLAPKHGADAARYAQLGDALAALTQPQHATRAYLRALWLSHDHAQQQRTSAKLRKLLNAAANAPAAPTKPRQRAAARPTTRPQPPATSRPTQPTSRPTQPRSRRPGARSKTP